MQWINRRMWAVWVSARCPVTVYPCVRYHLRTISGSGLIDEHTHTHTLTSAAASFPKGENIYNPFTSPEEYYIRPCAHWMQFKSVVYVVQWPFGSTLHHNNDKVFFIMCYWCARERRTLIKMVHASIYWLSASFDANRMYATGPEYSNCKR